MKQDSPNEFTYSPEQSPKQKLQAPNENPNLGSIVSKLIDPLE